MEIAIRDIQQAREDAEKRTKEAERARKEAEDRYMSGIPPQVKPSDSERSRFHQLYGTDSSKINIALVGTTGTGKSSFLNSLRGLKPRGQDAAPTGINETTAEVKGYPDPTNPAVVWYDVPGANTARVKGWSYVVDHGLYCFDLLIVVFSDRFTQTVTTLLSNANNCHMTTLLVRTKADQLIANYMDDEEVSLEEAKQYVWESTQDMVTKELARARIPDQRVYVVSKAAMKDLVLNGGSDKIMDEKNLLDMLLENGHESEGEGFA